jgi:5'-nucleotidase
LTRKNIQEAVENGNIRLRGGVKEFFQNAEAKNIPVLVLSAGLGDVIKEILKKEKINDKNILLISNFFEFDELGVAVGYKLPLIHTFNKNETVLPQEILEKFSGRTHVVLAGDSVGDLGMAEGLQVEKLFSFGFPNSTGDEKVFSEKFDIVIPSDEADFSQINYFLQTLGQ